MGNSNASSSHTNSTVRRFIVERAQLIQIAIATMRAVGDDLDVRAGRRLIRELQREVDAMLRAERTGVVPEQPRTIRDIIDAAGIEWEPALWTH